MKNIFLAGLVPLLVVAAHVVPDETAQVDRLSYSAMSQFSQLWGLDRSDGVLDGSYAQDPTGGDGVRIYIVDTGVDSQHPDLAGRVGRGFDAFGEGMDSKDCNGHGTHIAAVAAGETYGIAHLATVVPVRILDCSARGSTRTLLEGLEWIEANHPKNTHGIVNLSVGGPKNFYIDSKISDLRKLGLAVVAAAGNFSADACNYSPSGASDAITVGAVDRTDTRASYSNYGKCVDIFSPGSRIVSANSFDYATPNSRSGTSQSAPFVAGIMATYISNKSASDPLEAELVLRRESQRGVVKNSLSEIDSMAILNFSGPPSSLPAEEPALAPEVTVNTPVFLGADDSSRLGLQAVATSPTSVKIDWNSLGSIKSYRVSMGKIEKQGSFYRKSVLNKTSTSVRGLDNASRYWISVSAERRDGSRIVSNRIEFMTPYGSPKPPSNLSASNGRLSWSGAFGGGDESYFYSIERLSPTGWVAEAVTSNKHYVVPAGSSSTRYRILVVSLAGTSAPSTDIQVSSGAVRTVLPPASELSQGEILQVTQLGRGSAFIHVSWNSASTGPYAIQISSPGLENWKTIASTTLTHRTIAIAPGVTRAIRIVDSYGAILGSVYYRGR